MQPDKTLPLNVYIGWDGREAVGSDVAAHSIRKRAKSPISISYLKHRELRKLGYFSRAWLIRGSDGDFQDLIDDMKFSTEFSHTRFLVPELMRFNGWALFMDADMIFLSDISKLFALCDDRYAVMVVKHTHIPDKSIKMDGRENLKYPRKNWSSFVLWNCSHPANKEITKERVNFMKGSELHRFSWLKDEEIGSLPFSYNFISGVTPKNWSVNTRAMPDVIHYTEGGPWFEECQNVPYGGLWVQEYEDMQNNGDKVITDIPTMAYEKEEIIRK